MQRAPLSALGNRDFSFGQLRTNAHSAGAVYGHRLAFLAIVEVLSGRERDN